MSILDAYSKIQGNIKLLKSQPIESINLDAQYADMKLVSNLPSIYHGIGDRYSPGTLKLQRVAEDTTRYAKWLTTGAGATFTAKQFGMQLSQPKTRLVALQGTRIFNPVQFAANIPGSIIGGHFPRHGLIGVNQTYESVTKNQEVYGNRMIDMYYELGHSDKIFKVIRDQTKLGELVNKSKAIITKVRNFIGGYKGQVIKELSGPGGPKSVMGAGWTDIHSQNTGIDPETIDLESFNPSTNKFSVQLPYLNVMIDSDVEAMRKYWYDTKGFTPGTVDQKISKAASVSNLVKGGTNTEYQELKDKSKPYNSKDGNIPVRREDYGTMINGEHVDDNMFRKYGIPDTGATVSDPIYTTEDQEDFIRLKFKYPGEDTSLQFRATLMGLSNNFTPEWNSVDYVGRPDSVYTYKGVKRATTFSFMVAANSKAEMEHIYTKLNHLAAMTFPSYNQAGIMQAPIIYLYLGHYFYEEPGFISSLDFNIEDDYIWDIDTQEPMYIKVNVGFDIIGKTTPSRIDPNNPVYYFGDISVPGAKVVTTEIQ